MVLRRDLGRRVGDLAGRRRDRPDRVLQLRNGRVEIVADLPVGLGEALVQPERQIAFATLPSPSPSARDDRWPAPRQPSSCAACIALAFALAAPALLLGLALQPRFSTAASRNTSTARAILPISSPRLGARHLDVVPTLRQLAMVPTSCAIGRVIERMTTRDTVAVVANRPTNRINTLQNPGAPSDATDFTVARSRRLVRSPVLCQGIQIACGGVEPLGGGPAGQLILGMVRRWPVAVSARIHSAPAD